MKKTLFLVMVLFGVFLINNATQTYGMEMSAEEKMLWERTQKGWELWKNGEKELWKAGIHEDYIIWQSHKLFPRKRDNYADVLFGFRLKSYKLEPVEISISGNLALVMYSWTFTTISDRTYSGRSTIIFVKQDGKWHIMGAMQASCTSPALCIN
jgi:hypothetical protein